MTPIEQARETYYCMRQRCLYKKHKSYKLYGGAGVSLCSRWDEYKYGFLRFIEDLGLPKPGQTIDRIDSSKGYEPSNCRWAYRKDQNRNRRNLKKYMVNGKLLNTWEFPALEWIDKDTVVHRVRAGWTWEEAINTEKKKHRKGH